jgi:hypothetical protein
MGTKRIEISTQELYKQMFPENIIKDICEDETLCPTCKGLGCFITDYPRYHSDTGKDPYTKIHAYKLVDCPDCYTGIVKVCEFCGKPILKRKYLHCDCNAFELNEQLKKTQKEQEILDKAEKITVDEANNRKIKMLYYDPCDKYFSNIEEFYEFWDDKVWNHDESDGELVRPNYIYSTTETELSLDAFDILESPCEDLYEDAIDFLDTKGLQRYLDQWLTEQGDSKKTYWPDYKTAVIIDWDCFGK